MATTKTGTAIDASGNPIDVSVTSLTNGALADANDVMATLNDIETDVEGHSHSLDGAVGWDSLLASYRPPDTGDSTNKWRLVSGSLDATVISGTAQPDPIVFATDAEQGDPSFTSAPNVFVCVTVGGSYDATASCVPVSTTGLTCVVQELNGGTHSWTSHVDWFAYGKVA